MEYDKPEFDNGLYTHYKGGQYFTLGVGMMADGPLEGEWVVTYSRVEQGGLAFVGPAASQVFVRTLKGFLEQVTVANCMPVARFTKVVDETPNVSAETARKATRHLSAVDDE